MLDAAQYYEKQSPGLGEDFLAGINLALSDITEHPERWRVIRLKIRRRLIQRFPYALLYRVDAEEIVVLSIMHLHKRPDYWIERL